MRRDLLAAAAALVAGACAIGPSYRRPDVGTPTAWRPESATADSRPPVYDSLRATRESTGSGPPNSLDSVVISHAKAMRRPATMSSGVACHG